jgi:hypothetical protein
MPENYRETETSLYEIGNQQIAQRSDTVHSACVIMPKPAKTSTDKTRWTGEGWDSSLQRSVSVRM